MKYENCDPLCAIKQCQIFVFYFVVHFRVNDNGDEFAKEWEKTFITDQK